MNVIIVDDHKEAFQQLEYVLPKVDPSARIIKHCRSVQEATNWFRSGMCVDLIIMDVSLSDGTGFDVLNVAKPNAPVIFVTASDRYAIDAFRVGAFDYLLKPVGVQELQRSISRVKALSLSASCTDSPRVAGQPVVTYKHRFLTRSGNNNIKIIEVAKIAYFEVEGNYVTMFDCSGKKYPVDYRMEELVKLLDPNEFFRVSRQHIVNVPAIREIESYPGARLAVKMMFQTQKPIIVSAGRIKEFKHWLEYN